MIMRINIMNKNNNESNLTRGMRSYINLYFEEYELINKEILDIVFTPLVNNKLLHTIKLDKIK